MTRSLWPTLMTMLCLALLVAACRVGAPPGTASPGQASVRPSASSAGPPASAEGPRLSTPGAPYDATDILAAMRDSRRPGGVPDELETREITAAIADRTWTWDGSPWEQMAVTGACGPSSCSLELAGTAPGGAGTDLYSFRVDPASGEVDLLSTDLHGYPSDLEPHLDAAARAALNADQLQGLALVGGRWLPPPETDRYWLAYRSGGEEGSPRLDVLLDLASGEVLEVVEPD